jgi:hypothetical protein
MVRDMCMDCILGNNKIPKSNFDKKNLIYFSKKWWEKLE